MRIRLLTLFLGISLSSVAQDQNLLDNIWILEDLVLDSNSHLPPNNGEILYVTLDFDSYIHESIQYFNLYGSTCETIGGQIEFNNSSNNFSFTDGPYETLGGGCMQSQNAMYEDLYFEFFYNNYNNGNIFDYSIVSNNDGSKTLTINSFNGDQAIYNSQILSNYENEVFEISLFYNAKTSSIEIDLEKKSETVIIKIFNTQGRLVLNMKCHNKDKISIAMHKFNDAPYFVTIQDGIGQIMRKKILKH